MLRAGQLNGCEGSTFAAVLHFQAVGSSVSSPQTNTIVRSVGFQYLSPLADGRQSARTIET